jgi:hypothetical protein
MRGPVRKLLAPDGEDLVVPGARISEVPEDHRVVNVRHPVLRGNPRETPYWDEIEPRQEPERYPRRVSAVRLSCDRPAASLALRGGVVSALDLLAFAESHKEFLRAYACAVRS